MVLAAACGRVHIAEQHTCDVMLVSKGVIIVKMAVPANRLAIGGISHSHVTSHNFIVLLCEGYDSIL